MNRILLIATLICIAGCATNPVSIAKTNQQRAYAVYGEYVILEEQAAEFICGPETAADKCPGNPAVPDSVRQRVKAVDAQAAPVVDSTLDIVEQVSRMIAQLKSCGAAGPPADPSICATAQEMLRTANANLITWINQLLPLVAQLKTAVGR